MHGIAAAEFLAVSDMHNKDYGRSNNLTPVLEVLAKPNLPSLSLWRVSSLPM